MLHEAEARVETGRQLGLDPLSRARLGRDLTAAQVNAADLLTTLRQHAQAGGDRG